MGWKNCSLNFEVETNVTLAYLSQDGLHQISISTKSNETYLSEHEERFLSLCLCRTNFGQQFFVSPIQNETETIVHDAIILCLVGFDSFESIGIYDDYDLLDALLLKQFEHIPNSIIDPVKNHNEDKEHKSEDKGCYDFYGFPAVSF
uniref:Uncharacterized protein n=1 Tax=Panagrolaimus davidi TaxID=227884 RepID=A0A914P752_9BILA